MNKEKLKELLNRFIDSQPDVNTKIKFTSDLTSYVETISEELFTSPLDLFLVLPKDRREEIVDSLVLCGFGDRMYFNSIATWNEEESGYLFVLSKLSENVVRMINYVLRLYLQQQYNLNLDSIAKEDSSGRIVLDISKLSRKNRNFLVTVKFEALKMSEVMAESSRGAGYQAYLGMQGKSIGQVLGMKQEDWLVSIDFSRGTLNNPLEDLGNDRYTVMSNVGGKAVIKLESCTSDSLVLSEMAKKLLSGSLSGDIKLSKCSIIEINEL